MTAKINVKNLIGKNGLSDSDNDLSDDLEDSLIKDSVLKLTSNTFDEISPDDFVGAKVRNRYIASQNDIEAEYRGVPVSRKSFVELDSSNKSYNNDSDSGNDDCGENNDIDNDDNDDGDESISDGGIDSESDEGSIDSSLESSFRNESEDPDKKIQENNFTKKKLKTEDNEDTNYDIYSKNTQNNVSEDIEKGTAIRNQISIWETLLECRIKLQKALVASNKLPQWDDFTSVASKCSSNDKKKMSRTCRDFAASLQLLLTLQKNMMNSFPEFDKKSVNGTSTEKDINDDGHVSDSESISSSIASGFSDKINDEDDDVDNELDEIEGESAEPPKKLRKLADFSKELDKIHQDFIPARNAAIQKWNDKTRISSGRIKSSNFSAFEQSTLKQIEQILSDKDRLIKRTQTKRSVYKILGKNDSCDETKESEQVEYDPEIFDDDDFYHKILREFIEQKSADVTNVQQMGKQWAELQKMRSKMKRPIDVKATKGRKLRYTTHSKLVNFVAPIPYNSWTDEAESELFSSLFGEIQQK